MLFLIAVMPSVPEGLGQQPCRVATVEGAEPVLHHV